MYKFLKLIKSNFIKIIILLVLFFIFIIISCISYVNAINTNISDSVFRLHIIANSDSISDQNLKYLVRDNILAYINNGNINISSKSALINYVEDNKETLYNIAKDTLSNNGYNYDVSISTGKFSFPTKSYGDISLPAGNYDALRIELGNASGQNWWCVIFPPLCFIDATTGIVPDESKELLENSLDSEEYELVSTTSDSDLQIKFKIVEYFNSFKN